MGGVEKEEGGGGLSHCLEQRAIRSGGSTSLSGEWANVPCAAGDLSVLVWDPRWIPCLELVEWPLDEGLERDPRLRAPCRKLATRSASRDRRSGTHRP